jgi:hypothetical protein
MRPILTLCVLLALCITSNVRACDPNVIVTPNAVVPGVFTPQVVVPSVVSPFVLFATPAVPVTTVSVPAATIVTTPSVVVQNAGARKVRVRSRTRIRVR